MIVDPEPGNYPRARHHLRRTRDSYWLRGLDPTRDIWLLVAKVLEVQGNASGAAAARTNARLIGLTNSWRRGR